MNDERYFIGQILWDPSIFNKAGVTADDFLGRQEALLFKAMETVECIDERSLCEATGLPLLTIDSYKSSNIIASSWESVQKRIIEDARRRKLKRAAEEIFRGNMNADAMIDLFSEATLSVRRNASAVMERLPSCILEAVDDIKQRVANNGIDGLSTGFKKMDTVFGGLQKTRLYYVAARPSQGKSTLLMNMAANQKVPILFVTAESSKKELSKRLISYKGRIDNKHINNGTFTSRDSENLTKACDGLIEKNDFIIYDEANVPLNRLIAICHDAKKYYNVQAIFIDYIQIIRYHNDRLPRHEQAAEVSKALKQLARDLDLPVVCASQLRRDAEGKKPQLADMSDSTQLERDADIVMAIYNIPNEETKQLTVGEHTYVCVLKNRDGELGDIRFDGDMSYYYFQESSDRN